MPTIIILDVSLSMTQPVIIPDTDKVSLTRHNLAIHGINAFLDYLSNHTKLEFVALMVFSSLYEVVCGFTRDYESIKAKLAHLEEFDKTCIETALHGVNQLILGEWGNNTPCQVLLITDGKAGVGQLSLKHSFSTATQRDLSNPFALPFSFPGKLTTAFIASPDDPQLLINRKLYQTLVDSAGHDGALYTPELPVSLASITGMFQKISEQCYASFHGSIACGNLSSQVLISPAPVPYTKLSDFSTHRQEICNDIQICGFISVADVGSPMAISRHLVLPLAVNSQNVHASSVKTAETGDTSSEGEDTVGDDGKIPSFCVLLHGALKVENMAALVRLGPNWFGFLYSWADTKKKSNLMLTIMMPGNDAVPWLGDLNHLGVQDSTSSSEATPTFPVKPADKKSYSQNCVVWIKQSGLQSDIQKILRHARKLPEKTPQFYKELNRLRRAAISLGFMELLDGLAIILERECTLLPGNVHPDCALQLSHAATELRKAQNRDIKMNVMPLHTKFTSPTA